MANYEIMPLFGGSKEKSQKKVEQILDEQKKLLERIEDLHFKRYVENDLCQLTSSFRFPPSIFKSATDESITAVTPALNDAYKDYRALKRKFDKCKKK